MNIDDFLERNRITKDDWDRADITLCCLSEIDNDYRKQINHLNESAEFLANMLQKSDHVHSVRWRVKDPEHVLEKIVRKKASGSEKYEDISSENYTDIITDLVGIRVLHLFKYEWLDIHEYIKKCWQLEENVVAYIREGDVGAVVESYTANNCKVEVHPAGYRSIHYIISTQPTLRKVLSEIQVRTIFEEGWSEIDHKVRYPNFLDNKLVSYFLTIFNRMSGSADEMGTFVNDLVADIKWKELQIESKQKEQEEHLSKIEELAQALSDERSANKNKDENVAKLKSEIESLRRNSIRIPDISISKAQLAEIEKMTSLSREALKYSSIDKLNQAQMDAIKLADISKFSSAYYDIMNTKYDDILKASSKLLEFNTIEPRIKDLNFKVPKPSKKSDDEDK